MEYVPRRLASDFAGTIEYEQSSSRNTLFESAERFSEIETELMINSMTMIPYDRP